MYYKKLLGSYRVRPGYVSVGTSLFEILDPPLAYQYNFCYWYSLQLGIHRYNIAMHVYSYIFTYKPGCLIYMRGKTLYMEKCIRYPCVTVLARNIR